MKHYGDITKLSGRDLPPVDIVTGGSPCQDLSVAGLRAGLSGSRSSLFLEQIRIVKEMRDEYRRTHDCDPKDIKCRYLVWENVPGALTSAGKGMPKGSDFRCVLTEIVRIAEPDAPDVPLPDKGKWPKSGCLMGNGWSVAYRIHDAQFWGISVTDHDGNVVKAGTPQRRRRIALVADFGGSTAPDILFEKVLPQSQGVSGNPEPGEEEEQGTAGDSEDRSGESGESLAFSAGFDAANSAKTRSIGYEPEVAPTVSGEKPKHIVRTLKESSESVISFQERAGKPGGAKISVHIGDRNR